MKRKINTDINNDNDNDNQKQMKHSDRQRQDNPTMTSGHAASAFHSFRKKTWLIRHGKMVAQIALIRSHVQQTASIAFVIFQWFGQSSKISKRWSKTESAPDYL